MKFFRAPVFILAMGLPTSAVHAQALAGADDAAPAGATWRVIGSALTYHYHYDDAHRHVYSLGLERQRADGFVLGASWFRNSFGQPSGYAYAGHRFEDVAGYSPVFVQLTAGMLYGYKPPYEDKVPFNHNGFSPGAVFSVGWKFADRFAAQLNFLGNSALMLQFSADLP